MEFTNTGRCHLSHGQPRLDGSGLWLMPGVFDCHLHASLASWSCRAVSS
jgi:imidazolonepropionase-like amidohydrolase